MKKIIKIVSVLAVLMMVITCCIACDSSDTPTPTPTPDSTPDSGNNNENKEPEKVQYTITWKDENGNTLSSVKVDENTVPTPHAYEKADTFEWDYTVDGWSATQGGEVLDTIPSVTADVTYYAVVSQVKIAFTVTWKDENGKTVSSGLVKKDTVPTAPSYEKADTAEWDYTVDGWSATQGGEVLDTIPTVTKDATYYAVVSQVKRKYTVTFNTGDGSAIDSVTVEYGSTVNAPSEKPTQDGYRFVAWCSDASFSTEASWPITVTGNVTVYAKWNEQIDIKAYLSTLLSGFKLNPYAFIPETMLPSYSANLIDPDDIVTDYSSFVNVSDITMRGFGEQWNMVIDNIEQSSVFFNALTAVEGISASAISAFNNYIDKNPGDTAHHNFKDGIYSVTIDFDGEIITFVLDYTATFPVLGEQTAQIAMEMDIETGEKNVRVQLGDANAIHYTMGEGYYEFAIKYLGARKAYFSIAYDEDGNLGGHIYEFLTYEGKGLKSAADFYFIEDYVIAVGNKADGIIGMDNYICEVYDVEDGKMIGYEVREEKTVLGKTLGFDTLWFNLDQFSGITSVKYDKANSKLYVNGSSTEFKTKNVSTLNPSRRFDIEFRTQYFYSYDPATEKYTAHKVEVPMLFVQEDNLDTLTADIKAENKITVTLTESDANVNTVIKFYDITIEVFIENKETVTEEIIVAFIGNKKTF